MERLKKLSKRRVTTIPSVFSRFLFDDIDWKQSLIIILGHRGSGKTTLLLQRMKELREKAIYLSLDDIFFETNRLVTLTDNLFEEGYRYLFLDEVHRYSHWAKDLKNIYDNYPSLHIVATGSSILEVNKGQADLSRRAVVYNLPGLSFREFLQLEYGKMFSVTKLDTIVERHYEIAADYFEHINIVKVFREFLQYGYYPFFTEGIKSYPQKLQEATSLVLDLDIAPFEELTHTTVRTMKKLLYVISQTAPFIPNISKMSKKMQTPRNSVLRMLDILDHAKVISLLRSDIKGISYLQKPEKIYLQNPNLLYLLSENKPDVGSLRETFFFNQLAVRHKVTSSRYGDFMIDEKYVFEIGGPSKTQTQIKGIPNAYIAADEIKGGSKNKIPLWLFGFLY